MRVLGISAFYHDSAAALIEDGRVVAAAQEERFTRIRHDAAFPSRAVSYCLSQLKGGPGSLDSVVFYEKPFLKFERLLETYLAFAPRGISSFSVSMPLWIKQKLFQKRILCRHLRALGGDLDWESKLLFTEHHLSHAASAFYPSPFSEAVILTMDGVGEWATTSVAMGSGNNLRMVKEIAFPHSLGLLYSAFTYYCGFKVNSGEYKLMGLAPYGEPKYVQTILEHLIDLKADGTFRLNLDYFDYCTGLRMTNRRFGELFGGRPRQPAEPLEQRHMDLAASIQAVLDEAVLGMTRSLATETGARNLCLAVRPLGIPPDLGEFFGRLLDSAPPFPSHITGIYQEVPMPHRHVEQSRIQPAGLICRAHRGGQIFKPRFLRRSHLSQEILHLLSPRLPQLLLRDMDLPGIRR